MEAFLKEAKESSRLFASLRGDRKTRILNEMADALIGQTELILGANRKDLDYAKENNLSQAMVDRLMLTPDRIKDMAQAIREIARLKEPVGRVLDGWVTDDGLKIEKVSVPIGVIGIIYESRPNVTSDCAALCFKSGNVAVLKGGKEANYSNHAIAKTLQNVLVNNALPKEMISLLPDNTREGVSKLIKMDSYVDLIIPRGGEGLIRFVCENASVPVVKHDKGLCHVYLHEKCNPEMAVNIAINAKTHRTGVCNSAETLLVDQCIAQTLLPELKKRFDEKGTELRGCAETLKIISVSPAEESDWDTEYLDNILSIKLVEGADEAIAHVNRHGSSHSDSIVTEDIGVATRFLNEVDSAAVYVNASTRFTDGGVFGFGAEVGISTNKLHARGPMGINDLTTYKFCIHGQGQIR